VSNHIKIQYLYSAESYKEGLAIPVNTIVAEKKKG